MSRKAVKLIIIYTSAVIICLSLMAAVFYSRLTDYRRAALYSSRAAFEETVQSVRELSSALGKSVYAVDGSMCAKICTEASSRAFAAEAALSTLPFETAQLEQTSSFLNTVGEYTRALSLEAARDGFSDERIQELTAMAQTAGNFERMLEQLRQSLNNGETEMDSLEVRVANVDMPAGGKLSASLLDFEAGVTPMSLAYDGRYGFEERNETGDLSDEEKLSVAARAAGVAERELMEQYSYEGEDGLKCYAAGDRVIIVSSRGLESMASSRLIDAGTVTEEDAKSAAEKFLSDMGWNDLSFSGSSQSGGVYELRYCPGGDVLWADNYIRICIASDNGSVQLFDASRYSETGETPEFSVSRDEAAKKLPRSLTADSDRRAIVRSEGNRAVPVYVFTCHNDRGDNVIVYIDGEKGEQYAIEIP